LGIGGVADIALKLCLAGKAGHGLCHTRVTHETEYGRLQQTSKPVGSKPDTLVVDIEEVDEITNSWNQRHTFTPEKIEYETENC
jgi:hypothetical protein